MGFEDRHFLDRVRHHHFGQIVGDDDGHGFGGQIDVLLVLGHVARNGLVTQLGQLDADLLGGDAVGAVADHGPIAGIGRAAGCDGCNGRTVVQHCLDLGWKGLQRVDFFL